MKNVTKTKYWQIILMCIMSLSVMNCSPTIKVSAPDKPVEINLNVKIDHEIRVKVDKEIDKMLKNNEDIF